MTVIDDQKHALVASRAAAELADRQRLAAVVAAADAGLSQREIAAALGVSQPAVAKMLARARRWPQEWQRTPWQMTLEFAAGHLTREQLLDELVAWPWTYGHADGPDGSAWAEQWSRGSWDELLRAVSAGFVDESDYAFVLDQTRAA